MLLFALQACTAQDAIFELSPQQSMSITGKGPGQDAAYNPYGDTKSISVVKNLGTTAFNVRIQQAGKIIQDITIMENGKQEFILEKGYELYLDSQDKGKAKVTFKEFVEK